VIVPSAAVSSYLDYKLKEEGFSCFEVLHFSGTHGEMM
jgi:hypothetical protein